MNRDYFEMKAVSYEKDDNRVSNVASIANSIIQNLYLHKDMHLMDFGSGTGLLLERIAPLVRKITAVDVSKSMNNQLKQKQGRLGCELDILEVDLELDDVERKFDGIISSMTMHHVKDIGLMFEKFHKLLSDDGVIAISDLDSEDGNFHTEDTGVYHFGFNRDDISTAAKKANFRDVSIVNASIVKKPHGEYSVFLLTAKK
ncbi:class I SAM-dependent DNA methyltransferase [Teredinibacter waterburyi]|uniref:class I SAM-dependent DNA methyltransferase n=1 Tax=Teredinibacter waterburyi TaxID=1500538 RepID=UPI00165F73BC|nr:class I SAM-dependent methyltransferase [Teredinibacter waterburyi]